MSVTIGSGPGPSAWDAAPDAGGADAAAFAALVAEPPPQETPQQETQPQQPTRDGPNSGGDTAAAVNSFYQGLLGQDADPAAMATIQGAMAGGQSLAEAEANLRPSLAHSDTATAAVNAFYRQSFGRAATPGELANIEGALAGGQSLLGIETRLDPASTSGDPTLGTVNDLYQRLFGRNALPEEVDGFMDAASRGVSVQDYAAFLQPAFAKSDAEAGTVNAFYRQSFGRDATPDELGNVEGALAAGEPLLGIETRLNPAGMSGNPTVGAINDLYQRLFGRNALPEEVDNFVGALAHGQSVQASVAELRPTLAKSDAEVGTINAFYRQSFGRDATPDELGNVEGALSAGQSLLGIEARLDPANTSGNPTLGAINDLYQQMFGRNALPGEVDSFVGAMAHGQSVQASVAALRPMLAKSDAEAAKINAFYQDVLGQDADPVSLANIENGLAGGQSLAQVETVLRPQFAHSAMGAAGVQSLYQEVAGRAASGAELAAAEAALAAGQSRSQIGAALLNSDAASPAARQVNALYRQVLGRDADLGGLAANEAALARGATSDQLRSGLAHSAEAARDIDMFYQETLGRGADAAGLAANEDALARGLPLAKVRNALARSQESANQVQALYAKALGRAASPDELAGYEAAKAMALPPGTTFTVYAPGGATLASGVDAPTLVANLPGYVAASGGLTPTLATNNGQTTVFKDGKQIAAFAFAQAVASGQDTPATRQAVQGAASWLDQTGQAFTQAAANLRDSAKAATDAGDTQQAAIDNAGADLVQQMQATPPGQRHALSERVLLPNQFAADVSVSGDVEGDADGLAGFDAKLVDLDPERPGLVQDALAQAGAANRDAGNPILAALDQVQERLDLARLRLPADARHDKMFDVARQFVEHARGAAASGNWNLVQTFETAADVSLQEAAQPAGARQALTERFVHKEVKHDITVDPNAADPFATFKDHSKGHDDIGAIVEAVAGAVLNVAAIAYFPLWPAAAAFDVAQAGQDFSNNNTLGGFLSLVSAAGVTLNGLGNGSSLFGLTAGDLGLSPAQAATIGAGVLAAAAAAGGTNAVVTAAQKGDGLGIAAGLLQVAAAAADGTIAVQGGGSADLKLSATGLSVTAAATRLADGAQTGDLATALGDVGALAAALTGAVQQANTDPQVRARVDQFVVTAANLWGSSAGQGGTRTDAPGSWLVPGTPANDAFAHDTIKVLQYLATQIGNGVSALGDGISGLFNGNASSPPSDDGLPPPTTSPSDQTGSPMGLEPEDPEDPATKTRQDRLDSFQKDIDKQKKVLDEPHLDAARRELDGEIVKINPKDGKPFDHVTEVRASQRGLQNVIEYINDALGHPRLDLTERALLTDKLAQASRLLDYSKKFVP